MTFATILTIAVAVVLIDGSLGLLAFLGGVLGAALLS